MNEQNRLACEKCRQDELFEESYRVIYKTYWKQGPMGSWTQGKTEKVKETDIVVKCMQCGVYQMPAWREEFLRATQRPQANQ